MTGSRDVGVQRIGANERIASLDVLRGMAILFILFMNIPGMGGYEFILHDSRYPTWTAADWWTTFAIRTTLDGTQRGLLELLFGAGIMIMARGAMRPDAPVEIADLHHRRNLLLIVLGLFNAFVLMWWGDILLTYGMAAVFLFTFRKWTPKAQFGLGAIFIASLVCYNAYHYQKDVSDLAKAHRLEAQVAAHKPISADDKKLLEKHRKDERQAHTLPARNPDVRDDIAKAKKAHHSGFVAYWRAQFEAWQRLMGWFWIIEAEIVGTMLIGMALYQWRIIQGGAPRSLYLAMLLGGYGVGFASRGMMWWAALHEVTTPDINGIFYDVARLAVTLGHVGLIQLTLSCTAGQGLLRPFQAAGRMPLTVYLFTSFLMMWIVFAPWGFNLWGIWGQATLALVAAAVIAIEVVAANLWLHWYETGPMEWLWKSAAYGRRMPFRKRREEPDIPPGLVPAE